MTLELSCALVPGPNSPEYVAVAESLGYRRALMYDSPALYPDVWAQLCRAADRTTRIGLGPGVMVPSNRHPMVTASAIATLAQIAGPERVLVAVGTGFTSRAAMGRKALSWSYVREYVRTVQALLAGEVVTWQDASIQMLHSAGVAPSRPLSVAFAFAVTGDKGRAAARELADGVISTPATPIEGFALSMMLTMGTVLDPGEDPDNERVLAAAGHAGGVLLHYLHETGQLPAEDARRWLTSYDSVPEGHRHLEMHRGHLVELNEHDRPFVTGRQLVAAGMALQSEEWVRIMAEAESAGVTEIVYQPAGPNIPAELERFASVHARTGGR